MCGETLRMGDGRLVGCFWSFFYIETARDQCFQLVVPKPLHFIPGSLGFVAIWVLFDETNDLS